MTANVRICQDCIRDFNIRPLEDHRRWSPIQIAVVSTDMCDITAMHRIHERPMKCPVCWRVTCHHDWRSHKVK